MGSGYFLIEVYLLYCAQANECGVEVVFLLMLLISFV